jgi:hypothetical protein
MYWTEVHFTVRGPPDVSQIAPSGGLVIEIALLDGMGWGCTVNDCTERKRDQGSTRTNHHDQI